MSGFTRSRVSQIVTFRLTESQRDFLEQEARTRGIKVADLIREALEARFGNRMGAAAPVPAPAPQPPPARQRKGKRDD